MPNKDKEIELEERNKLFGNQNNNSSSTESINMDAGENIAKENNKRNTLLTNTSVLGNTHINAMLEDAIKNAQDTEIVGRSIIINLDGQKEQIIRMQKTNQNINTHITKSNGILTRMLSASSRAKFIGILIILITIFLIIIIVYMKINN